MVDYSLCSITYFLFVHHLYDTPVFNEKRDVSCGINPLSFPRATTIGHHNV